MKEICKEVSMFRNMDGALFGFPEMYTVPKTWYKKIVTNKGRPDFAAILLLSEIVKEYTLEELKRSVADDRCTNTKNMFIVTTQGEYSKKLNLSKIQIRKGLKKLKDMNLIYWEYKNYLFPFETDGGIEKILMNNHSYIEPRLVNIRKISS